MISNRFREQLIDSGYLHMLLKPDTDKSVETRLLKKKVTKSKTIPGGVDAGDWKGGEQGRIEFENGAIKISVPSRFEPEKPMPHYSGFLYFEASLPVNGEDWREYNRLVCKVKPYCPGMHDKHITISVRNDGVEKIPDVFNREGSHVVNLESGRWTDCVWEFPDLPRDKITELTFSLHSHGKERMACDEISAYVRDIRLEYAEDADASLGWQGNAGTVSFSTTGYWLNGAKTAVAHKMSGSFEIIDEADGKTVFSGEIKPFENEKGSFGILDFSAVDKPGRYRIKAGDYCTPDFAVDENVMEEAAWKALNFIYAERCGYPVGGGHTSCHSDIAAEHNGLMKTFNGGWHDAGDLSQQTLQTGEVVQALFELAERVKDQDKIFYRRLTEEARWGLDFVMKSRFGDGTRAFSVGLTRRTNELIGDFDGEPVRCHNRSFDNWMLSGIQALSAHAVMEEDPDLAWVCLRAAKEDYGFALARFNEVGVETRVKAEHTHNAGLSQYYAVASWAASMIFRACGEDYYAAEAGRFGQLMTACQDTGESGLPFKGFFCRDAKKKQIVHFNHQSREYLFTQALQALCVTQKDSPCLKEWENAMRMFGDYQKAMCAYAAPYNMIPAGVHRFDEAEDAETFELMHPEAGFENNRENYKEQLANGVRLDENHCGRHFPVWFSYRGNTAVQMAAGKAASIAGKYFGDDELLQIARDQLYWVSGRNPFRQSLIYGEGSNYAKQYAALCGETVGEMPVGIQTRGNGDEPYWPMATYATYKEIWMSSAGHWLRLLADVY